MGVHSFLKTASVFALAVGGSHAARIIQANDDGWAELYLRSFHDALIDAGHDAVVSAPAENESARSMCQFPTDSFRRSGLWPSTFAHHQVLSITYVEVLQAK